MSRRTQNTEHGTKRSWNHRIARLIGDSYNPSCQAGKCPKPHGIARAALFVCEWDQMQGKKAVSRQRLFCMEHALNFAQRHSIAGAELPIVLLSELETANRDDWAYAEDAPINRQLVPKVSSIERSSLT